MNVSSTTPEGSSLAPHDSAHGFDLLHADDALLAVVKPAGLPCVPARAAHLHDCLSQRVQAVFDDALIVHRLDMATSGLVLMARGKDAQRRLGIAFADRTIRKRYVAIVEGRLTGHEHAALEIDHPLMADWPNRPMQKVDAAHGKPSLTRLWSLFHDGPGDTTRVRLEPVTGRTHQLRVHLRAIGHPIVGDALYGSGAHGAGGRLLLHASELWLSHPLTGQALHFTSEPEF